MLPHQHELARTVLTPDSLRQLQELEALHLQRQQQEPQSQEQGRGVRPQVDGRLGSPSSRGAGHQSPSLGLASHLGHSTGLSTPLGSPGLGRLRLDSPSMSHSRSASFGSVGKAGRLNSLHQLGPIPQGKGLAGVGRVPGLGVAVGSVLGDRPVTPTSMGRESTLWDILGLGGEPGGPSSVPPESLTTASREPGGTLRSREGPAPGLIAPAFLRGAEGDAASASRSAVARGSYMDLAIIEWERKWRALAQGSDHTATKTSAALAQAQERVAPRAGLSASLVEPGHECPGPGAVPQHLGLLPPSMRAQESLLLAGGEELLTGLGPGTRARLLSLEAHRLEGQGLGGVWGAGGASANGRDGVAANADRLLGGTDAARHRSLVFQRQEAARVAGVAGAVAFCRAQGQAGLGGRGLLVLEPNPQDALAPEKRKPQHMGLHDPGSLGYTQLQEVLLRQAGSGEAANFRARYTCPGALDEVGDGATHLAGSSLGVERLKAGHTSIVKGSPMLGDTSLPEDKLESASLQRLRHHKGQQQGQSLRLPQHSPRQAHLSSGLEAVAPGSPSSLMAGEDRSPGPVQYLSLLSRTSGSGATPRQQQQQQQRRVGRGSASPNSLEVGAHASAQAQLQAHAHAQAKRGSPAASHRVHNRETKDPSRLEPLPASVRRMRRSGNSTASLGSLELSQALGLTCPGVPSDMTEGSPPMAGTERCIPQSPSGGAKRQQQIQGSGKTPMRSGDGSPPTLPLTSSTSGGGESVGCGSTLGVPTRTLSLPEDMSRRPVTNNTPNTPSGAQSLASKAEQPADQLAEQKMGSGQAQRRSASMHIQERMQELKQPRRRPSTLLREAEDGQRDAAGASDERHVSAGKDRSCGEMLIDVCPPGDTPYGPLGALHGSMSRGTETTHPQTGLVLQVQPSPSLPGFCTPPSDPGDLARAVCGSELETMGAEMPSASEVGEAAELGKGPSVGPALKRSRKAMVEAGKAEPVTECHGPASRAAVEHLQGRVLSLQEQVSTLQADKVTLEGKVEALALGLGAAMQSQVRLEGLLRDLWVAVEVQAEGAPQGSPWGSGTRGDSLRLGPAPSSVGAGRAEQSAGGEHCAMASVETVAVHGVRRGVEERAAGEAAASEREGLAHTPSSGQEIGDGGAAAEALEQLLTSTCRATSTEVDRFLGPRVAEPSVHKLEHFGSEQVEEEKMNSAEQFSTADNVEAAICAPSEGERMEMQVGYGCQEADMHLDALVSTLTNQLSEDLCHQNVAEDIEFQLD